MQTESIKNKVMDPETLEQSADVCVDSVQGDNKDQLAMLLYQIYKNEKEVVKLVLDD
jgi:hypothetical protein